MTVRLLLLGLLLLTAAVFQTSLLPSLTLLGFRPDLLALLVLAAALRDGPVAGASVGAVAGLLTDLLSSQAPAGIGMLVYAVIGYVLGQARPYLAPESLSAPLLLAFGSGALATGVYGMLGSLLADDRAAPELLVRASLLVGLYTALLAPAVLWAVRRLFDGLPLRSADRID